MNQVEQIGKPLKGTIYPQSFIFFGKFLILATEEFFDIYELAGGELRRKSSFTLMFPCEMANVIFTNIWSASEKQLIVVNQLLKPEGFIVHSFGDDLVLQTAETLFYDQFTLPPCFGPREVLLYGVDKIFLDNKDTTFCVFERRDKLIMLSDKQKSCMGAIVYLQQGEGTVVYYIQDKEKSFFEIVNFFDEGSCFSTLNIIEPLSKAKIVFADANLMILLAEEKTFIFGVKSGDKQNASSLDKEKFRTLSLSKNCVQLPLPSYALGATHIPGRPDLYVIWGSGLHLFDSSSHTLLSSLPYLHEVVHCFPLSSEELLVISFSAVELVTVNSCQQLLTFAPHILGLI